ncbi:hypothetical protein [Mesorhizobium sp. SP-1A]|uniref:hypothetical protein n=1 Tax=Mesorhizobium sp. SP-1A TaxID=3077840 RepID=UPI0028F6F253|nr:hypothetical protein [Mesorhizobium sp. SP-1A]
MTDSASATEWAINLRKELALAAQQKQFDYGKWVLASLLTVHLGALLLISQAGSSSAKLFQASGTWLIYGVIAALFTGGLAWINFTLAAISHWKVIDSYLNGKEFKPSKRLSFGVNATFIISPILAIVSLVLFLVAAQSALSVLNT